MSSNLQSQENKHLKHTISDIKSGKLGITALVKLLSDNVHIDDFIEIYKVLTPEQKQELYLNEKYEGIFNEYISCDSCIAAIILDYPEMVHDIDIYTQDLPDKQKGWWQFNKYCLVVRLSLAGQKNLSESEETIIYANEKVLSIKDIDLNEECMNEYKLDLLSLAIKYKQFQLAKEILLEKPDLLLNAENSVNYLILTDLVYENVMDRFDKGQDAEYYKNSFVEFFECLVELVDVDYYLNSHGIHIGILLIVMLDDLELSDNTVNSSIQDKILSKFDNHMYDFVLHKADISEEYLSDGKVHILIASDKGNWSYGAQDLALYLEKNADDIQFHVIDLETWNNTDKELLKQFDGFITPGADDNYPQEYQFNLEDFSEENFLPLNKLEIEMMQFATANDIPTLGMCAGAQSLVLVSGGSLSRAKNQKAGSDQWIDIQKDSLGYFMCSSKEVQDAIWRGANIDYPEINFEADTAYTYAGVIESLNKQTEVMGVTKGSDGKDIPMCYHNGTLFATQFHPENKYHEDELQHNWIDSFLNLTRIHHKNAHEGDEQTVLGYLADVQDHLNHLFGVDGIVSDAEIPM